MFNLQYTIEPSNWKPLVKKENILLIAGLYDQYIEFDDSLKLQESWNNPQLLTYHCGHSGIVVKRKKISVDVLQFLNHRLFEKFTSGGND